MPIIGNPNAEIYIHCNNHLEWDRANPPLTCAAWVTNGVYPYKINRVEMIVPEGYCSIESLENLLFCYGVVTYPAPLTDEQIAEYDLEPHLRFSDGDKVRVRRYADCRQGEYGEVYGIFKGRARVIFADRDTDVFSMRDLAPDQE